MKISEMELDPALVEEGVWRPFDDDGAAVKIASMEKKTYQNKMGRMMTRAMMQSRVRDLEATKRDEITYKAMVGTIIMGFKGFQNDDGGDVVFSDENVLRMLADLPKFRRFCQTEAADDTNFRRNKENSADDDDTPVTTPEAHLKSGDEVPA
jgi:hypothetical protein